MGEPDKITVSEVKMDGGSIRTRECSSLEMIPGGKLLRDEILASQNWIYFSDGSMETYSCTFSSGNKVLTAVEGSLCYNQNVGGLVEGLCDSESICQYWDCAVDLNCYSGNPCYGYLCDGNHECSYELNPDCELEEGECGDGVINIGESCDGNYFNGENCGSLVGDGYFGSLECINDCGAIDATGCISEEVRFFTVGDGSSENPFEIDNCYQLQNMSFDLSANYEVVGNVDCSITNDWNEGKGFSPLGGFSSNPFTGSLDGNDFEISGLYINEANRPRVGLISYSTGEISNLGLVGINVTGRSYVGGLVGHNFEGTINECYSDGSVTVIHSNDDETIFFYAGGLVGYNEGSEISNSYSSSDVFGIGGSLDLGGLVGGNKYSSRIVNSSASGNVEGNNWRVRAGGLVGYNHFGSVIESSYATGNVNALGDLSGVGGLVGYHNGGSSIISSYSTGNVEGNGNGGTLRIGGFVGMGAENSWINDSYSVGSVSASGVTVLKGGFVGNDFEGSLAPRIGNSYYLDSSCSGTCSNLGTSKNSADLLSKTTYNNWDFENVWNINSGWTYPWLRSLENCGNGVLDLEPCDLVGGSFIYRKPVMNVNNINLCSGWSPYLDYTSGTVSCTSDCQIDFSQCS